MKLKDVEFYEEAYDMCILKAFNGMLKSQPVAIGRRNQVYLAMPCGLMPTWADKDTALTNATIMKKGNFEFRGQFEKLEERSPIFWWLKRVRHIRVFELIDIS